MINVTFLTTDELKDLASAIKEELDNRKQHEINQAIDDFEHAFKRLQELRVNIKYYLDRPDVVYLRDWDKFNFC